MTSAVPALRAGLPPIWQRRGAPPGLSTTWFTGSMHAVSTNPDLWLSPEQRVAIHDALLPIASPETSTAIASVLADLERLCLDTAVIGMVTAYESSDGWLNRFHLSQLGGVGFKNDAGWPSGLWLPPASITGEAEALVRERCRFPNEADEIVEWTRWILDRWWRTAGIFGGRAVTIDASDQLVVEGEPPVGYASSLPGGELEEQEWADLDLKDYDGQCVSVLAVSVVFEWGATGTLDRRCILPAQRDSLVCGVHSAIGVL